VDLPDALAASLRTTFGDGGRRWVEDLPERIVDAQHRWDITVGAPFQPGGVTSFVAPATDRRGNELVYKITVPHEEAVGEEVALSAYGGDGAVELLASRPDSYETLLERAIPGTDLWSVDDDRERIEATCGLMSRMWRPVPESSIGVLAPVAARWADITERRLITVELPWISSPIERGIDLLRTLPRDRTAGAVLLHGDLHPGNILAAEREPWLAIDPKPLIGDPAFDPVQILTQQAGRISEPPTPSAVEVRLALIGDLVALDPERIGLWALARTAEWSMWSFERGDTIDAAIAYSWTRTLDALLA
jgi:streptomycin 6-kinase